MSLSLTVDGERWRSHLLRTVRTHPGIVPVAKGNGYGLSVARLARRAQWLADHVDDTGAAVDTDRGRHVRRGGGGREPLCG